MNQSPFLEYRDMVMGHYGTASWLRSLVMAMWNGSGYPVGLSQLGSVDEDHFNAAMAMLRQYRAHGENDCAFMALAEDIRVRMENEHAADEREQLFSDWRQELRYQLLECQMRPGDISNVMDEFCDLLETEFDAGHCVEDVAATLLHRATAQS